MINPSKLENILLFQPTLENTCRNDTLQNFTQICTICDLNIEAGSLFEHLATAHSDPTKETPSKKQHFSLPTIPKEVSVKTTKSAPKPKQKRKKSKLNISGTSTDANILISHEHKSQQQNLKLDEMIFRFKIKTCEIKLKRCDEIVADFNKKVKPAEDNGLEPKPASKRMPRSKIRKDLHLCRFSGCRKGFSFEHKMKRHYRVHSGEKPYKCEVCNKQFAYSNNLTVHARVHTGDKPFECKVCSKRFVNTSNLANHERIHTGETPFKCPYCSKRCRVSSYLTKHVRIVHKKVWNLSLGKKQQGQNLKIIEANPKNLNKKQTGSPRKLEKPSKVATSSLKATLIKRRRGRPGKVKGNDLGEKESKTFPSIRNQEENVKADQDNALSTYVCSVQKRRKQRKVWKCI